MVSTKELSQSILDELKFLNEKEIEEEVKDGFSMFAKGDTEIKQGDKTEKLYWVSLIFITRFKVIRENIRKLLEKINEKIKGYGRN